MDMAGRSLRKQEHLGGRGGCAPAEAAQSAPASEPRLRPAPLIQPLLMKTLLFIKCDLAACLNRLLFSLAVTFASQYHRLVLGLHSAELPVCILL